MHASGLGVQVPKALHCPNGLAQYSLVLHCALLVHGRAMAGAIPGEGTATIVGGAPSDDDPWGGRGIGNGGHSTMTSPSAEAEVASAKIAVSARASAKETRKSAKGTRKDAKGRERNATERERQRRMMSAFRCLDDERIEKVPLPNTPAP